MPAVGVGGVIHAVDKSGGDVRCGPVETILVCVQSLAERMFALVLPLFAEGNVTGGGEIRGGVHLKLLCGGLVHMSNASRLNYFV